VSGIALFDHEGSQKLRAMDHRQHEDELVSGVDPVDDPIIANQNFPPNFIWELWQGSSSLGETPNVRGRGADLLDLELGVSSRIPGDVDLDRP
jgi:hypothetical protein